MQQILYVLLLLYVRALCIGSARFFWYIASFAVCLNYICTPFAVISLLWGFVLLCTLVALVHMHTLLCCFDDVVSLRY